MDKPNKQAPPDGGWGWVIVFSSFTSQLILAISYGNFAILYMDYVEQFGGQSGHIGWIGSGFMFAGNICCEYASNSLSNAQVIALFFNALQFKGSQNESFHGKKVNGTDINIGK